MEFALNFCAVTNLVSRCKNEIQCSTLENLCKVCKQRERSHEWSTEMLLESPFRQNDEPPCHAWIIGNPVHRVTSP